MTMPILKVEDLYKTYQNEGIATDALRGVSFSLEEGAFAALTGASGCGKTTLFNLIAGLITPSNGKIWINQQDITQLSNAQKILFRRQSIGFVFQRHNLLPVLTAEENIALIMQLQKQPKKLINIRVQALIEKLSLYEQRKKYPAQLSGGQQQRVAVARALAARPALVLADEPTANLDLKNAENLMQLMKTLNEEEGITFLFSTHDARVMRFAQEIITLENGKLVL